jgi:predicted transcriptional regulator
MVKKYSRREETKVKLLYKMRSIEQNITSICRGIVDISLGSKYIKQMEKEQLVKISKRKNISIVEIQELGLNKINEIEGEKWK